MIVIAQQSLPSKDPAPAPVAHTALVLYGATNEVGAITRHKIVDGKLGFGRLVSPSSVYEQLVAATKQDQSHCVGLLPHSVLQVSSKSILWYQKRQKRLMWFRVDGKPSRSVMVEWPPLLFKASLDGRHMQVFALASNSRPDPSTRLYHAPLMNIGSQGELCQGTARLPNSVELRNLQDCEACLYDSVFTHVNHRKTLFEGDGGNSGHLKFWERKAEAASRVSVKELVIWDRLNQLMEK